MSTMNHPDNQQLLDDFSAQMNALIDGFGAQLNARLDDFSAQMNARVDGVSAKLDKLIIEASHVPVVIDHTE